MYRDEMIPPDIRASIVTPRASHYQVVGNSHLVFHSSNVDKSYEERVQKTMDLIEAQLSVQQRDKTSLAMEIENLIQKKEAVTYDGQRVHRLHESIRGVHRQDNQERFLSFTEATNGSFVAFDIETVGDSQDRVRPYGITEISMNRYDGKGVSQPNGYNYLIRQSNDTLQFLEKTIQTLESDPYLFNTLPGWQQRSVVDLMRYATYQEASDRHPFSLTNIPSEKGISNSVIRHHSIIDSVFDTKDQLSSAKVVQEMKMYLPYMKSGLETLRSQGNTPEEAMKQVAKVIFNYADVPFFSYNGESFDVPVLKAFGAKHGVELPAMNHLDLLNVIHGTYVNSDDLKKQINPDYNGTAYGKDKQAAYIKDVLAIEDKDFHNARIDTDNLAQLVVASKDPIRSTMIETQALPSMEFALRPSSATWNEEPLLHGQTLFSNTGIGAYKDGDRSFRMAWDEATKSYLPVTNGINKTVIEPSTFYQFAGIQDMSVSSDQPALAFRFFHPETKEYAYLVREGENAFDQLRDVTQSHFYDWETVDPKMRRQITHELETDRARRRYDRYFSLEGAGKGIHIGKNEEIIERGTAGFSGYKRMLANVAIMDQYNQQKGQSYRDRVANEMREHGLTRNQAKKKVRRLEQQALEEMLDFRSRWNPETQSYQVNESEKKAFFKMYPRLREEAAYYQPAITAIDETFAEELKIATSIKDPIQRSNQLKAIGQKRDRALMAYHQGVLQEVGAPVATKPLLPIDATRIRYQDFSTGQERSINFEKVATAQKDLYKYAIQGVEENHPNRANILKERMNHLLTMLHSQDKITKQEFRTYQEILSNQTSVYNATQEIALLMRQSPNLLLETERELADLTKNQNIHQLPSIKQQQLIVHSLEQAKYSGLAIQSHKVAGKRVQLEEPLRRLVEQLDAPHFSQLSPNNYQAIEELLASIHQASPMNHVSLTMDPTNPANMRVYVYDGANSAVVQNQLGRNRIPAQALAINLPLISSNGTHQAGARVVNAHQVAVRNGKSIELISTAQQISRGYSARMKQMSYLVKEGKIEEANQLARRVLNDELSGISGIQRSMEFGANDTYKWANNQSDFLKQSHIKLGNAMVEDFFYNGYDGIQLTEKDFFNPEDVFQINKEGQRVLKRGIELSDVQMDTQYKMLLKMPQWAEEKIGPNHPELGFYTSGLKSTHVGKGAVSAIDLREFVPYGENYNHSRDNLIQYMNAYLINDTTREHLQGMEQSRPGTIYQQPLLQTPAQRAYENTREAQGLPRNNQSFQARVAYITQQQFRDEIYQLETTVDGRRLLKEVGLLKENGEIDYVKLPRLYEQQGMIDEEFYHQLSVNNEKRIEKGPLFEMNPELEINDTVKPGQWLGTKTHVSGEKEPIYFNGKTEAILQAGRKEGEDILLQWKDKPFKFMLDGEKITDSPIPKKLLQAITGSENVVMAFNPEVTKHNDFGMVMSGQARLLAEHVNSLPVGTQEPVPVIPEGTKKKQRQQLNKNHQALLEQGQARQQVIQTIEQAGIGLTWEEERKGFIQHSRGKEISRHAFDEVFDTLGLSNKTGNGKFSMGILETKMSNVQNYSKNLDATGRNVIGWKPAETGMEKIYGNAENYFWGHREMGVLRSLGMEKTYEHAYALMMEQAHSPEKLSRLKEAQGVADSLKRILDPTPPTAGILPTDFQAFPEQFRNEYTYRGTVFDRMYLNELSESHPNAFGAHGFWLELPKVTGLDGTVQKVNVAVHRNPTTYEPVYKEMDRIFLPYTNVEGANGEVHLRELQQHIKKVVEKAQAVPKATSMEEARKLHTELERVVKGYVNQSSYELSSSKGILIGDAFKANMASTLQQGDKAIQSVSGSGLFKLMDLDTSLRYGEGQFSIISEQMAKDLGVYERLKNGEKLYNTNVRFPIIGDTAMQFTQLRMDASIKGNEIHTTSFGSFLLNADSDGDYSFLTIIDDKDIQAEWKGAHDQVNAQTNRRFQDLWETHLEKETKEKVPVSLAQSSADLNIFTSKGNSDEEMAAKIGKMTIGRASNLNLALRQLADQHFTAPEQQDINYKIKQLGQGLEQKPIDSKHGAKPVGLQLIDQIYAGNWQEVIQLDKDYFGGMFAKDYYLKEVAEELPIALQHTKKGLRTTGVKFGTSSGVSSNEGIQTLIDLLYGNADAANYGGNNASLEMFHRFLGIERPEAVPPFDERRLRAPGANLPESDVLAPVTETSFTKKTKQVVQDLLGGPLEQPMERIQTSWNQVKNMSGKNQVIVGGALALAGLAGYNIFNSDAPERPAAYQETAYEERQSQASNQTTSLPPLPSPMLGGNYRLPSEEYDASAPRTAPAPRINTGLDEPNLSTHASIQIQASGPNMPSSRLAQSIEQGMQQTGMPNRSTSISIHQTDNSNRLTRQWYQEKVRENI